MKALTLHQPHATLIKLGVKKFETRSWRAPDSLVNVIFAIHAGKTFDEAAMRDDRIRKLLPRHGDDRGLIPQGGIVAVVRLLKCRRSTAADREYSWGSRLRPQDFGDFSDGRWVWETELLLRVHPPVMCRGFQGLWRVPESVALSLEDYLTRYGRDRIVRQFGKGPTP